MNKPITSKVLTSLLAAAMLSSMAVPAFAADYQTLVKYTGPSGENEHFTLTVPATMAPGDTEDVTLEGAWRGTRTYTVTADKTVEMKSNIVGFDKTLSVTFPGITLQGSDTDVVSETQQVSVEGMTMQFGTYEGTFNYTLTVTDNTENNANTEDDDQTLEAGLYSGGTMLATWDDLVNTYGLDIVKSYTSSNYNTEATSGYSVLTTNFSDYNNLKLVISDSVTNIGNRSFRGCIGLTSVIIPDSATIIGIGAFEYCTNLTSITLPDALARIGDSAFWNCTSLTSITLSDSLTSIGNYVFSGCTGLTSVTILNGLTSIGNGMFDSCAGLTSINYTGTQAQWEAITKGDDWNYRTGNYTIHCTDGDITKS